jgi:hypothetical protein
MIELLRLILHIMASLFKPRAKLVAEILILRQQLNVLRRQVSKRPRRPSSWRNQLEQISAERKVSLNVALEADSLSLQTHIVSEGGVYALLGPYAIAAASKACRLQSSKLVDPVVTRHIALAMSRHGSLTLACRTVMQDAREIATSGAAGLRHTQSSKSRG